MEKEILLSVVIPTYNRYQYLKDCINSILQVKSDEFELVVHDNSEDNTPIKEFIDSLNDERFHYYHMKEHVDMSRNSDLAVSYAQGKYVCMLGDDDSICSGLIDTAKFCKDNNIDAVTFLYPGFNWPDMTFAKKTEPNFFLREKADGSVVFINTDMLLKKSMSVGGALFSEMPRAYHGIVSMECMKRIYDKTGSFFPGPSPDVANSTAVCLECKNSVFISDYLMVSGYGHKSARGEGNRKEHFGNISEKPWLPKDTEVRWNKDIPKIFSGETIIAQSMWDSLKRMGRDDLAKKMDFSQLYAMFLWHHKTVRKELVTFCLATPKRALSLLKGLFVRVIVSTRYKLNKENKELYLAKEDVKSLYDAQNIVAKERKKLGLSADKYQMVGF